MMQQARNVRQALIDAGIQLLSEGGPDALTLRKCAALAGVSHAAPAHHFDGLPGLLAAIATLGFERFAGAMEAQAAKSDGSDRGRLWAVCRGYVAFARQNPALFDLMFRHKGAVARRNVPLAEAGDRAYGVLRTVCAPFVPAGEAPEVVESQVWALVHGYTGLRFLQDEQSRHAMPDFEAVMALLDRIGTRADL